MDKSMYQRCIETLNSCHKEIIGESGLQSIHTTDFPKAYLEQAVKAMFVFAKEIQEEQIKICVQELYQNGSEREGILAWMERVIED